MKGSRRERLRLPCPEVQLPLDLLMLESYKLRTIVSQDVIAVAQLICFGNQDANIAHVGSRRSGCNHVAKSDKERIRIAAPQKIFHLESSFSGALKRRAVDHRARGGTVPVNSISSGAESDHVRR